MFVLSFFFIILIEKNIFLLQDVQYLSHIGYSDRGPLKTFGYYYNELLFYQQYYFSPTNISENAKVEWKLKLLSAVFTPNGILYFHAILTIP